MPVSLANQNVLVLGASSGIGRETAILFARAGARVMAAARRLDRLTALQQELAAEGHQIEIQSADAASLADMEALAVSAAGKLGSIDIMVYVTGTNLPDRYLPKLTPANWDMMIGVNLNGAFYITHAILPEMRQRGSGYLIFVSSISGKIPDVSGAAYQAAKRGLLGLAHAIRVEEKDNGIRTSVVMPGLVESELLEKRPVKPTAEMLAKAMQPIDVAEAIFAVASLPSRVTIPELMIVPTKI